MTKIFAKVCLKIFLLSLSFSQEIPENYFITKKLNFSFNSGINWNDLSHFGPYRYTPKQDNQLDSLQINNFIFASAYELYQKGHKLNFFLRHTFKDYFYIYLNPVFVNDANDIYNYSGINRPKSRFGFRSGQVQSSGIGLENDWALLQFGRGVQSWGAGENIQISLNHNSSPYDFGLIGFKLGGFKSRYFYGYLENKNNSNRYIIGKGIEYNNKINFIGSLSEIVIISGKDRPIDIAYLNPVSSHLEIELNDRQNLLGTDSGNAIWQLSFDYFKNKIRMSTNFVFDEISIDKTQKNDVDNHFIASSFKFVYLLKNKNSDRLFGLNFYLHQIIIGKYTFRHERVTNEITGEVIGYNNFVHKNYPLGWQGGSDFEELKLGSNVLFQNAHLNLFFGFHSLGDHSLVNKPYVSYDEIEDQTFDSIKFKNRMFFGSEINFFINEKIEAYLYYNLNYLKELKGENFIRMGLKYYIKSK